MMNARHRYSPSNLLLIYGYFKDQDATGKHVSWISFKDEIKMLKSLGVKNTVQDRQTAQWESPSSFSITKIAAAINDWQQTIARGKKSPYIMIQFFLCWLQFTVNHF